MEVSGKIIEILPETTGEGKNGRWRSQDAVLETQEQYPRKVCFNLFNDKIDQFKFEKGDDVTVFFDIDSREYNGRWYTNIRAWKVEKKSAQGDVPPPPMPEDIPPFVADDMPKDDLPF